jgi:hypothetical protein
MKKKLVAKIINDFCRRRHINAEKTNEKTWFYRQGTTFFPATKSSRQFTLNLTAGKDILFKNIKAVYY